jgi:hypothetical protein
MQTTLATLLFVTAAVLLACVVVNYTVAIFEQTLDTENSPQIEKIHELEAIILNETDNLINNVESLNQTSPQQIDQILP